MSANIPHLGNSRTDSLRLAYESRIEQRLLKEPKRISRCAVCPFRSVIVTPDRRTILIYSHASPLYTERPDPSPTNHALSRSLPRIFASFTLPRLLLHPSNQPSLLHPRTQPAAAD